MINVKKDILWRIGSLIGFLTILGIAIIIKVSKIQFVEGDKWRNLSDSLTLKFLEIEAQRGNIYDANKRLLSVSYPIYDVHFDPTVAKDSTWQKNIKALCQSLSQYKNQSAQSLEVILNDKRAKKIQFTTLLKNIDYLTLQSIKKLPILIHGQYKGGLIIEEKMVRKKPFGALASRTVGTVTKGYGRVGIENFYNNHLNGVNGKRLVQKISGGYKPINDDNEVVPINGLDVFSTIDINIQDAAHYSLLKALYKHNAQKGIALVMEVETGAIKAMVNLNSGNDGYYYENMNNAISYLYEPGSTFKALSFLALLENTRLNVNDTIDINKGIYNYGNRQMVDSDKGKYSRLNIKDVFVKSSNVGTSKLITQEFNEAPEKYIETLKSFGISSKTSIDLRGEAIPVLKNTDDQSWSGTSLPWMSIGYEVSIAPIQLLNFYNTIANNGVMMKPYVVESVGKTGLEQEKFKPQVLRRKIASEKNIRTLQQFLAEVVSRGTASNISSRSIDMAGKTGTALIAPYYQKRYIASFAGYFPVQKPKYSCLIVVVDPRNGQYYGGSVAAPVFADIAEKIYKIGHAKDLDSIQQNTSNINAKGFTSTIEELIDDLDWDISAEKSDLEVSIYDNNGTNQLTVNGQEYSEGITPNLKNLGLKDANTIARKLGYKLSFNGIGKVVDQLPKAGQKLNKGEIIKVNLE